MARIEAAPLRYSLMQPPASFSKLGADGVMSALTVLRLHLL